jgi:cytoskeletal protein RodZ
MQETNESLGTYLKRSRENKNVSIEQVAYATRISLKMLRALEEDAHGALPAPTFVRGYLQAYSKYIRIDTQDLLLRYQHHLATSPDHKRNTIRSHYLYVRERYQEKRRLVLVIVLFATMLSVAGTYFLLKAKREHHKRLAQTTAEIQKGEQKAAAALPLALTPPTPAEKNILDKDKSDDQKTDVAAKTSTETKTEPKAATKPAEPVVAKTTATQTQTEAKAVTPPPAPVAAKPTATTTATATQAAVADAAAKAANQKKNFNLMLKTETDVWLRFQTDQDAVRDLTLRAGRGMMLRADNVIKIFSGNLRAFKATLNGQLLANGLAPSNKAKSVVLPESEASKYPLPLFPQFQTKQEPERASNSPAPSTTSAPQSGGAAQ